MAEKFVVQLRNRRFQTCNLRKFQLSDAKFITSVDCGARVFYRAQYLDKYCVSMYFIRAVQHNLRVNTVVSRFSGLGQSLQ